MSITKETARECKAQIDTAQLHEIVRTGLQQFLNALAAEGFLLPLDISLHDTHGDILREFKVERGEKTVLGCCSDETALFVFPLFGVARDAHARIAVLKLDATTYVDSVASDTRIEFVN